MNLDNLNQNGITSGPRKLVVFLRAAELTNTPPIGSTPENTDPVCRWKIFDPCGSWSWYVAECDPQTGEAWGIVYGQFREAGYFCLRELSDIRGPLGIGLEVDIHWKAQPFSEVLKGNGR